MNEITPARALNGKFRSKKLDFSKPLKILRFSDLQPEEIEELFAIGRSVPAVATGVDKEEEKEHHLMEALNAHSHGKKVTIPVPEASTEIPDYSSLYRDNFKLPKHYIKCISKLEERISVPYNLNESDNEWLSKLNEKASSSDSQEQSSNNYLSELHFEVMMNFFEVESSPEAKNAPLFEDRDAFFSSVPFAKETGFLLEQYSSFVASIFAYWKEKRTQSNGPLIPRLRIDEYPQHHHPSTKTSSRDSNSSNLESYVCFRRREVKSQRKTRKSESCCMDKLRKLKSELEKILALLEMTCKRDKYKKESLNLDSMIFDQIYQFELWKAKWAIKPQSHIPSIKSIFDVYGYGSTIAKNKNANINASALGNAVKDHKLDHFLQDSLLNGHASCTSMANKLGGFQSSNLLKSCRSFAEFRQKYLKAHNSSLSKHFLESFPSPVTSTSASGNSLAAKCGEKAQHYREVMRKILQEMDRKVIHDKAYQDLTLFQCQPTEPTYSWRVGRSRLMHQGPFNLTEIGVSHSPSCEQVLKTHQNSMNARILGPQDILSLGNPCVYNLNSHYMNCSATLPRTFMYNMLAVLPQHFAAVPGLVSQTSSNSNNSFPPNQNSITSNNNVNSPSNSSSMQPGVSSEFPSASNSNSTGNFASSLQTFVQNPPSSTSTLMKHSLSLEEFKTSPNPSNSSRQSFIGIESHSLPNFSIKKRKKEIEIPPPSS